MAEAPDDAASAWKDRAYPAVLVAGALVAYLSLACPYVLGGDSGELVTLAARGGVAHPSGYPLFTLLMHPASTWLAASPALGAARETAVLAALAAGGLYAACRSFRASRPAALLASTMYALSPLAWLYATQAEVFALAALLASGVLWFSGPECPLRGGKRLTGLAFVAGLGLSHHHTVLALAPVGLLGVVYAWREAPSASRGRWALWACGAFALGLTPYTYLLWASRHPEGTWVWGGPMQLHELWRHFERAEYWAWKASDHRIPEPSKHWAALGSTLERGLLGAGVPVALLGLAAAFLRGSSRPGEAGGDRAMAAALTASLVLAGPVMLAILIGKPVGVYATIIERLHLLPLLLTAPPLAWGADILLSRVPHRARGAMGLVAVGAVAVVDGVTVPATIREAERPTVEQYLRNTLAMLPPEAVVFGSGDHRCFGFLYEQTVLGLRPDVTYVEAGMLADGWYRDRIARALSRREVGDDPVLLAGSLADGGTPVFVTDSVDRLLPAGRASYAVGTVVRVLRSGVEAPPPTEVEAMNLEIARAFVREPIPPRDRWGWAGDVDATYARPWLSLARAFEQLGDPARARLDRDRAASRSAADFH